MGGPFGEHAPDRAGDVDPASKVKHVVIILKENHTFDNYFGTFPGANGAKLPRSSNPPAKDSPHTHAAWLTRQTTAVREQFVEQDIPAYFSYARKFSLCDNYYTDVAGPSTPNHLMLLCADSPIIDNPSRRSPQPIKLTPSLPKSLEQSRLTWRSYGGYAIDYLQGINSKWKLKSDQFRLDATAGQLPEVSWVYAPLEFDEHPPYSNPQGVRMGNVTKGMQWSVDQVNAIIHGGLWPDVAVFITWDDWGGWYDHVEPPAVEIWNGNGTHSSYKGSQFRYGPRVGCIVLGPYARNGYISKVLHSHVSLLRFCEVNFGLATLNQRDARSDDMLDCFDFGKSPAPPPPAVP
jgi:phospholipase C